MAQDDLQAFYQDDPNDPFRSLWLYLVEREIDPKAAVVALQQRYEKIGQRAMGMEYCRILPGKISENR